MSPVPDTGPPFARSHSTSCSPTNAPRSTRPPPRRRSPCGPTSWPESPGYRRARWRGSSPRAMQALADLDARAQRQRYRELPGRAPVRRMGPVADKPIRNRLLQLRRDLLGGRVPRSRGPWTRRPSRCRRALVDDVRQHGHHFAQAPRRCAPSARHTTPSWPDSRAAPADVGDDDFRPRPAGVERDAVSEPRPLSPRCPRYPLVARDEQIERGLLHLHAGAAIEATPFATLCTVLPVSRGSHGAGGVHPCRRGAGRRHAAAQAERRAADEQAALHDDVATAAAAAGGAPTAMRWWWRSPRRAATRASPLSLSQHGGHEVFRRLRGDAALLVILEQLVHVPAYASASSSRCSPSTRGSTRRRPTSLVRRRRRARPVTARWPAGQDIDWDVGLAAMLERVVRRHRGCARAASLLRHLRSRSGDYAAAPAASGPAWPRSWKRRGGAPPRVGGHTRRVAPLARTRPPSTPRSACASTHAWSCSRLPEPRGVDTAARAPRASPE